MSAGVHASASPFEALAERLNWMRMKLEDDPFGKAMIESGIPKETIMTWTKDPQVSRACLFDARRQIVCVRKRALLSATAGQL